MFSAGRMCPVVSDVLFTGTCMSALMLGQILKSLKSTERFASMRGDCNIHLLWSLKADCTESKSVVILKGLREKTPQNYDDFSYGTGYLWILLLDMVSFFSWFVLAFFLLCCCCCFLIKVFIGSNAISKRIDIPLFDIENLRFCVKLDCVWKGILQSYWGKLWIRSRKFHFTI